MSPHISTVIKLCLRYITYDPNYNYDVDEGGDEDGDESMDTEDGEDEDQGTQTINKPINSNYADMQLLNRVRIRV